MANGTNNLDKLLNRSDADWLGALPAYQRDVIQALLAQGKTPEEVAKEWLNANGPLNNAPFGVQQGASPFFDKLLDEFEIFMCRDDKYVEDKKQLLTQFNAGHIYVVGGISAALASTVGAAAAFIAPAVVMILITASRMGRNAFCKMREEQRIAATTDQSS